MDNNSRISKFSSTLLHWHEHENFRSYPWRGEMNPYYIWLSEIIMQQTRSEQGLPYYLKFKTHYPTVRDLALVPMDTVLRDWQGLGYYSRARNLKATAVLIHTHYNDVFPSTYSEILKLKGVGPYTAAAIASFAFGEPCAVVDGNVIRVLSRIFGIEEPFDTGAGKKAFDEKAKSLIDKKNPALYNQAIMDFGATVCKPKVPLCNSCVLNKKCKAYTTGRTHILPIKGKSIIKKNRHFYYFIATYNSKVYVCKRAGGDIWENLYEFLLVENEIQIAMDVDTLNQIFAQNFHAQNFSITKISKKYKQQLTHQTIQAQFIHVELNSALLQKKYQLISLQRIKKIPFPKIITAYFEDKNTL